MKRKKAQGRYLHLRLNDAIYDKKADLRQLTNEVDTLKTATTSTHNVDEISPHNLLYKSPTFAQ